MSEIYLSIFCTEHIDKLIFHLLCDFQVVLDAVKMLKNNSIPNIEQSDF